MVLTLPGSISSETCIYKSFEFTQPISSRIDSYGVKATTPLDMSEDTLSQEDDVDNLGNYKRFAIKGIN